MRKQKKIFWSPEQNFKVKDAIGGSISFWVWTFTQWSMCHLVVPLTFCFPGSTAKKAIIGLKNEDDECFKWAIIRTWNPVEEILDVLVKNFEENQRSSIGMVWNFQSIWLISINLKIIILQFLLMYSVRKNWFVLLE